MLLPNLETSTLFAILFCFSLLLLYFVVTVKWALFMGFDHERIHLETSSVLIRQLPLEMVRVPVNWRRGPTENGKNVTHGSVLLKELCWPAASTE